MLQPSASCPWPQADRGRNSGMSNAVLIVAGGSDGSPPASCPPAGSSPRPPSAAPGAEASSSAVIVSCASWTSRRRRSALRRREPESCSSCSESALPSRRTCRALAWAPVTISRASASALRRTSAVSASASARMRAASAPASMRSSSASRRAASAMSRASASAARMRSSAARSAAARRLSASSSLAARSSSAARSAASTIAATRAEAIDISDGRDGSRAAAPAGRSSCSSCSVMAPAMLGRTRGRIRKTATRIRNIGLVRVRTRSLPRLRLTPEASPERWLMASPRRGDRSTRHAATAGPGAGAPGPRTLSLAIRMAEHRYDPQEIEPRWQRVWAQERTWEVSNEPDQREKSYVLEMLPYPSGEPHIGHLKVYSVGDAVAHFHRRTGRRVLHPMGYDAFGLPAENHAIKTGQHPRVSTDDAIKEFRRAFHEWGMSIDWSREFGTHEPRYYRWTQWIFLQLFHRGLAYRKEAAVKWCPNDQTVLANEQVIDGRCERCGFEVEAKQLEQWFFRITDYADRLLDDLDTIEWPEHVKTMQRNWIGRSYGAEVIFRCEELDIDFS